MSDFVASVVFILLVWFALAPDEVAYQVAKFEHELDRAREHYPMFRSEVKEPPK